VPSHEDAAAEEGRLLASAGAGDRAAFRELYRRFGGPLFSLGVRMVGNRDDAEELLQDAFVKIWHGAAAYEPRKARPFTWAMTIMRNTCIDHLRRHRREPDVVPLDPTESAGVPAAAEGVRAAAEAGDERRRVREALGRFADSQRAALELALFSGLTQAEIAVRLGQPVGTVKSWIRRGLLDLRGSLSDLPS